MVKFNPQFRCLGGALCSAPPQKFRDTHYAIFFA
jgi:hypothetical protein